MAVELETKLAEQLYREQLTREGKTAKVFEEELLQEALGKLFDRTSPEFKLFRTAVLQYHKQEKINRLVQEKLSRSNETLPEIHPLTLPEKVPPVEEN